MASGYRQAATPLLGGRSAGPLCSGSSGANHPRRQLRRRLRDGGWGTPRPHRVRTTDCDSGRFGNRLRRAPLLCAGPVRGVLCRRPCTGAPADGARIAARGLAAGTKPLPGSGSCLGVAARRPGRRRALATGKGLWRPALQRLADGRGAGGGRSPAHRQDVRTRPHRGHHLESRFGPRHGGFGPPLPAFTGRCRSRPGRRRRNRPGYPAFDLGRRQRRSRGSLLGGGGDDRGLGHRSLLRPERRRAPAGPARVSKERDSGP